MRGDDTCTNGSGVCDACKDLVVVVEDELIRVSDLDHCPFALDYSQEEYIESVYGDIVNSRLVMPTGELPQWLLQGISEVTKWNEANPKEQ